MADFSLEAEINPTVTGRGKRDLEEELSDLQVGFTSSNVEQTLKETLKVEQDQLKVLEEILEELESGIGGGGGGGLTSTLTQVSLGGAPIAAAGLGVGMNDPIPVEDPQPASVNTAGISIPFEEQEPLEVEDVDPIKIERPDWLSELLGWSPTITRQTTVTRQGGTTTTQMSGSRAPEGGDVRLLLEERKKRREDSMRSNISAPEGGDVRLANISRQLDKQNSSNGRTPEAQNNVTVNQEVTVNEEDLKRRVEEVSREEAKKAVEEFDRTFNTISRGIR